VRARLLLEADAVPPAIDEMPKVALGRRRPQRLPAAAAAADRGVDPSRQGETGSRLSTSSTSSLHSRGPVFTHRTSPHPGAIRSTATRWFCGAFTVKALHHPPAPRNRPRFDRPAGSFEPILGQGLLRVRPWDVPPTLTLTAVVRGLCWQPPRRQQCPPRGANSAADEGHGPRVLACRALHDDREGAG
jgi:hypothetical protein